ncbi:MAG: hypothetical protein WB239_12790 [Acidimicrobiia bacterium]
MRAADLLGRLDSPALRVRLLPVYPQSVRVHPPPWWLRGVWPAWVGAMTLPWGIYVRPDLLRGHPESVARLLCHELVHLRQWKTLGVFGFLRRYLIDYLGGRAAGLSHHRAYQAIDLEVEAAQVVASL